MFCNIQIDLIILKTYDQQFTLTTKKSLHIIFKDHSLCDFTSLIITIITFRVRRSRGKCIVAMALCLYLATLPHYCTDPDVTGGMVVGAL